MRKAIAIVLPLLILLPAGLSAVDEDIVLPQPRMQKTITLEEVFNRLRTERVYANQPLTLGDLSEALWAAAGGGYDPDAVTGSSRTIPRREVFTLCGCT